MRVAQVGTSDLDNLGDLLFPLALRALLDELARQRGVAIECVHFGPRGCAAGQLYPDQPASLPLAEFERHDAQAAFDLVFIGGGDLLRDDDASLGDVYPPEAAYLPYSYLLSPTAHPARRLVLLMPGAPFEINPALAEFLRNSFTRLCAAAVRDRITHARLAPLLPAGLTLQVLPDCSAALPHYHPRAALAQELAAALPAGFAAGGYIVFQSNPAYCPDPARTAALLRELEGRTGLPVLLLETGACLNDGALLDALAARGFAYACRTGVLAKVAVIAAARAFVGTSLHGNILAHAYGLPHFCFAGTELDKLRGYFAGSGSGMLVDSLDALAQRIDEVAALIAAAAPPTDAAQADWRAIRAFVAQALDSVPVVENAAGFSATALLQYRASQAQMLDAVLMQRASRKQLEALGAELEQARRNTDVALDGLRASTSWRITAPLRALRGWFGR